MSFPPKVSIIIPVYNTEPFVEECIESLKSQSISNFECFLIDDCSIDKSYETASKATAGDGRFQLLQTPHHIGCGATRNIGLAKATGEYVYIMDSDDYLYPYSFEKAIQFAEQNNLDMALFDVKNINSNAFLHMFIHEQQYLHRNQCYGIASGKDMLVAMIKNHNFSCNVFTYIMKRNAIEVRFPEIQLDEDMLYTIFNMASCSRVGHLHENLYVKRARRASLLNSGMTFEKTISMIKVVLDIAKWIADGLISGEFNKEFADVMECHLDSCSNEIRYRWKHLPQEEQDKMKSIPYYDRMIYKRFVL